MTYCGFVPVSVHCLNVQIEGLHFASCEEGINEHSFIAQKYVQHFP